MISSNWLRNNFIHLIKPSLLNKFRFSVSCNSNNHRLQNIFNPGKIPYLFRCLISINNRHRSIHKNKSIAEATSVCLINLIDSFLAIEAMIYSYIFKSSLSNQYFQAHHIVWFIIYNQNAPIFIYFIDWKLIYL